MRGVSYQVFARKYRPQTFDDVLGQDHVVQTLKNAIEQKRLAHAYLFVGPRGTGKTSTARIFAKALNCPGGPSVDFDPNHPVCQEIAEGRNLDVLEIDGASNNGVEQVRDLRDNVQFMPSSGQFRIFYIDEVHMLSKAAFNALLKTLEEPPAHVKFIFATTEAHKILPTILSRCQRFDLRPISTEVIAAHLLHIASCEGVSLSPAAALAVAKAADGGMRDAQSMLDQLVSFCGNSIEESHVLDIFGITSRETVGQVLALMLHREISPLLQILNQQSEAGRDLTQFLGEMIFGLREMLIAKVDATATLDALSPALAERVRAGLASTDTARLLRLIEILAETEERMKWATNKRLHLEIGLIKAVHSLSEANISDIIRALDGAPLIECAPAAVRQASPAPAPEPPADALPPKQQEEPAPLPQQPDDNSPADSVQQEAPASEEPAELPPHPSAPEPEELEETNILPEQEADLPLPAQASPLPPVAEPAPPPGSAPAAPPAPLPVIPSLFDEISEPSALSPSAPEPEPASLFSAPAEQEAMPTDQAAEEVQPTDAPSPAASKISFLDDAPVRPMEIDPEVEDAPMPIDRDTGDLFSDYAPAALPTPTSEEHEILNNGAELWNSVLTYLEETAPLKHISIEHTPFLRLENGSLFVGVHPEDTMARDTLLAKDTREKIETFIQEKTGISLLFHMEITDKVPLPEVVELEPLPVFIPPPAAPRERRPTEEELKAKQAAEDAAKNEAKAQAEADFYNDPLIQEALDMFHAKIIS